MRYVLLCLLIFFDLMQLAKIFVAVQGLVWACEMVAYVIAGNRRIEQ